MTATSSATKTTTNDVVDAFFTAFGSGDGPGLIDLFDDKADFFVSGSPSVPWAGAHQGKTEFGDFFASFGKHLTAPDEFTILTRIVEGEQAAVMGRCVFGVLSTGKKFENRFTMHFVVQNGKITKYNMYEDSYAIHAAFQG